MTSAPVPSPARALTRAARVPHRAPSVFNTQPRRWTTVVGVGGDNSWQTLAWAVADATVTGGRLLVSHVCRPDSGLASHRGQIPLAVLELTDPPLARAIAAARDRLGGHRVVLNIATGNVGDALVRAAEAADVVVLGAPRLTGWAGRASTTHDVIRRAPCPTVVVRPVSDCEPGPFAGQIVVGVDGSAPARAALEFAFGYAAAHRRALAAIHVSRPAHGDLWFDDAMLETQVVDEPRGMALLANEVEPWRHRFPAVPVRPALYGGRPLPGLLRAAAGARLLVVGDHGRGPAARLVLGSVTYGAVDRAQCPVAVVHDDASRKDRPR
jgi:nucleotide-binding universal stress UspA family protein